jgi:hypothetical protein
MKLQTFVGRRVFVVSAIKTIESDQSFEFIQQIPRSAGYYLPVHLQLLKFLLVVRGKNASNVSLAVFSASHCFGSKHSNASVSHYSSIRSLK